MDAAGNKIWLEKDNGDSRMVDAVAWLCKYIGASADSRYYSFLETLLNSTDNKKILKYAKGALSLLPSDSQTDDLFTLSI